MASTTRRSTRGKREENTIRECVTAPKQIDCNQDTIDALKNQISEQAQKIEVLTNERNKANDSVFTLKIELEQLKKLLRAGKTEQESKSLHHIIGRRKKCKESQATQLKNHLGGEPKLAANAITEEDTG